MSFSPFAWFNESDFIVIFLAILINFWIRFLVYKSKDKFLINAGIDFFIYYILQILLLTTMRKSCWCGYIWIDSSILDYIFAIPYGYFIFTEAFVFLVIFLRRYFLKQKMEWWKFIFIERLILLFWYYSIYSLWNVLFSQYL